MGENNVMMIAKVLPLLIITALFFPQCAKAEETDVMPGSSSSEFTEDRSLLLNPERGWYISRGTHEVTPEELADFKNQKVTMILLETNLGLYVTRPLDSRKLDEIDRAFSLARSAGLSVMYRAAYDFDGRSNPDPKEMEIILNHIKQLKPVFEKYEDILFNVQAGFLGPWGEWHHSRYGDPIRPEYQRQVVNALFDVVPESVTIAVRRPEYIRNIADDTKDSGHRGDHKPVTRAEAFGNSKIARLAFHNDALMSDSTDMDTYIAPDYPRQRELDWINKQTRFTPMVAETNLVSSNNDTEKAIKFLDSINIQSLNMEYHPRVLRKWKNSNHDGMNAFDYIGMMIGYRFVLNKATIRESTMNGGCLRLDLEMTNSGFGHLLKEKKFEMVLKNDSQTYRAVIAEDLRFWDKNEKISRIYYFQLPSDLVPGTWNVYLGLSSTYESLADNPAYSVRFANKDIWEAETGLNRIGTIKLANPGESGNGPDFIQIKP